MRKLVAILVMLTLALPLVTAVAPTITHPEDVNIARGDSNTLRWTVTDGDNATGNYTLYRNSVIVRVAIWTNNTPFSYTASNWRYSTNYLFEVQAGDMISSNATDSVWVRVGGYSFGNVRMFVELLPFLILAIVMFMVVMQLRRVAP